MILILAALVGWGVFLGVSALFGSAVPGVVD